MRSIKPFLPIVLIGVSLCVFIGCSTDESSNINWGSPSQQVPFRLPDGWETKNEDGAIKAHVFAKQNDSELTETLLFFYIAGTGGNDSPDKLRQRYVANQTEVDPDEQITEIQVIRNDDSTIWVAEKQTESYYNTPWWDTHCFFTKNGRTFIINVNDKYENQKQAITMLIETLDTTLAAQIYESQKK